METMKSLFLEDPTTLYVILGVAMLGLLLGWHYRRQKILLKLAALPILLAGGLFILDAAVMTDREELHRDIRNLAERVEARQIDGALEYLDPNYRGFRGDREGLANAIRVDSRMDDLEEIRIGNFSVDVHGRQATMRVQSVLKVSGSYAGTYALNWTLYWIKRPEGWRIEEIKEPQQAVPGLGI